jgi:hypothetical protein
MPKNDWKVLMMNSSFLKVMVLGTLLSLAGCSLPTNKPLSILEYSPPIGTDANDTLIVMLRGRSGSHKNFEKYGFIEACRARGLDTKILAPNTHMGYFMSRRFVDRMKTDVIDPAKQEGYDKIWLVGVSLGGLGSLIYTQDHPEDITGVFLISPFTGNDKILDEIIAQGGPLSWDPDATGEKDSGWQRGFWKWLKTIPEQQNLPPIHLSYGRQDRLIKGQQLLATLLPEEQVFTLEGDHKYTTFAQLWETFLDREIIQNP